MRYNSLLEEKLTEYQHKINNRLDEILPSPHKKPKILHEAMRYSVMAGGKRLRPILALEAYNYCGGRDFQRIIDPACALELIHSYSLIHDDLPCMDDDELRRGKPTLHKKYSEYIAVLAGDALHALAFEILSSATDIRVVREVAKAIGTFGMVGGQVKDVEAEGKDITLDEINFIHIHKTAALISASVKIGAMLAKAPEEKIRDLAKYGDSIGLAFQIVDDILDIEGDKDKLGKPIGSDELSDKATYPKAIGLEQSKKSAAQLIDKAKSYLKDAPKSNLLIDIADYILKRQN